MAKVACPGCGLMNIGYIRIYDEKGNFRYHFSDCLCPVPVTIQYPTTIGDLTRAAGLWPVGLREEKDHG